MRKIISFFAIFCMSMLFSINVVFADNAEWKADNVDFSAIKTVYIEPDLEIAEGLRFPELDKMKTAEILEDNQKYLKNYSITTDREQADAIIKIRLESWGNKTYWQEPYVYTDYRSVPYVGSNGKTYFMTVPVTRVRDGYYYDVEYFSAVFTVTDKAGNLIYKYVDRRAGSKNAYKMFGRATKTFYKDLNNLK